MPSYPIFKKNKSRRYKVCLYGTYTAFDDASYLFVKTSYIDEEEDDDTNEDPLPDIDTAELDRPTRFNCRCTVMFGIWNSYI